MQTGTTMTPKNQTNKKPVGGPQPGDSGQGRAQGAPGARSTGEKRTVRFNLDDTKGDFREGYASNDTAAEGDGRIPFWTTNPNVLLDSRTMLEFYPVDSMSFTQKLNALTRAVLVILFISLFITQHPVRILFIGILCLTSIWGMYEYYRPRWEEGLANPDPDDAAGLDVLPASGAEGATLGGLPVYQQPTPENPFSNVLVSDYDNNPHKLPAPPASNPTVQELITQNVVRTVQQANPTQPDISEKLFRDLNEQLTFEQSMRPFVSNPATTIPNDQGAFAQFCYGDMISCKEGNMFACGRNTNHYTNY